MNFFKKLFGGDSTRGRTTISNQTLNLIKAEWEQIDILVGEKGPSQLRHALLKADKTLDNALKDIVSGETLGERLISAKDKFDHQTYDKIWKAHKIRNSLVHESGYEPPYHMITGAINSLREGLKKLGVPI